MGSERSYVRSFLCSYVRSFVLSFDAGCYDEFLLCVYDLSIKL